MRYQKEMWLGKKKKKRLKLMCKGDIIDDFFLLCCKNGEKLCYSSVYGFASISKSSNRLKIF